MRITRHQLREIIREAHGGAHESYVVERSGESWDERFFVELAGGRTIVYGPFEQAKQFPNEVEAQKAQTAIDEIDGYHARVQPTSSFKG